MSSTKVHIIFLLYDSILGGLGKAIFLSFRIHCVELFRVITASLLLNFTLFLFHIYEL